jgi:hypothetical protein
MKANTKKNVHSKLVKLGVVDSKVNCEESLRSGFVFGLWTRYEMKEVQEVDYLESFLKKVGVDIEELRKLENDTERLELTTEVLSKQKNEFKLWFKVGLWTYIYTWLLGHDYSATETEEARLLIQENIDIRKAGSSFIVCLQDLDWSPDKIESFNLDKLIPFLWEEGLRKWTGNPDMAVMSDLRYEARLLDLKAKEDNTESRVKSALKEGISGIPVVGKSIAIMIFGNKK